MKNSTAVHHKQENSSLQCSYRPGYMVLRADKDQSYKDQRFVIYILKQLIEFSYRAKIAKRIVLLENEMTDTSA